MTKSQIRAERRQRSHSRKRRRRTFYVAAGSLLALVFILSLTLGPGLASNANQHGGGDGTANEGGPVPINPDNGGAHIGVGLPGSGYTETPPTSGPHWFARDAVELADGTTVHAPARWGTYTSPIPPEVLIHNLEHGGIGLHYNCPDGCDELVNQLKDLVPRSHAQFIVSPYRNMEPRIAITAWRHHLHLNEFDKEAIEDFIDAYQDRAPESIPGNSF